MRPNKKANLIFQNMDNKIFLDDIDLNNKRIFLRVDWNVPISNRRIQDDYRITRTLPTIKYILSKNPKSLCIGTHLGRPKGKYDFAYSLEPVFIAVRTIFKDLGHRLHFQGFYESLKGEYVLFDNLRFYKEEENIEDMSRFQGYLKTIADLVILDAYGCVHRQAGSITHTGLPVYGGYLMQSELKLASYLLNSEKDIDLIIVGGKKVKDKIKLLKGFIKKSKQIFIAGGMCFTFLKALGQEIGDTEYEKDAERIVKEIYEIAKQENTDIILPDDFIGLHNGEYKEFKFIPKPYVGVDIGSKTTYYLNKLIQESTKTFWNGPPGIFEIEGSSKGTESIVRSLSTRTRNGGTTIVGGGDTASSIQKFGDRSQFTYISTGGGSLLSILEGKELPGIKIIEEKKLTKKE